MFICTPLPKTVHMETNERLQGIRQQIVNHPLYQQLHSIEDLRVFASYHVFAVWDFMSLLKSLQQQLTCVAPPWVPVGSASTRFLINEIVTGEESDIDLNGQRISHFELYLQAMDELGADTTPVKQLLLYLQHGMPVRQAMQKLKLPDAVQQFCSFTFDVIEKAPVHAQAAVFTYGREDLIPDMFMSMVQRLQELYPSQLATFTYYLQRHIEVDGDHHSYLAAQMVAELCGADEHKQQEALELAHQSLEVRKRLWDGVLAALPRRVYTK